MTDEPEVHYVPEVRNEAGYVTQPARYFVSQAGWGRRFASRVEALAHLETLTGDSP